MTDVSSLYLAFRSPSGDGAFRSPSGDGAFRSPSGDGAFRSPSGDGAISPPAGSPVVHSVAASAAPEWLHLVPAGVFRGRDGRGPYQVKDAEAVIAASMADGKIALDENHATDFAMATGVASPARGWFDRLEARADGIWGHVEWTESGAALMSDRAYRGVSPVFSHGKDGTVTRILRAALTNTPNIAALATLHSSLDSAQRDALDSDDFAVPGKRALPINDERHVKLAWDMVDATQGLSDSERAAARSRILARAKTLGVDTHGWTVAAHAKTENRAVSAHAKTDLTGATMDISAVRQALGLPETADEAACLAAMSAQAATVARQSQELSSLGATMVPVDQMVALQAEVSTLKADRARDIATAAVDAAIAAGKPIVPVREQMIAQHTANPEATQTFLDKLVSINAVSAHAGRGSDGRFAAAGGDGEMMSEEDKAVCAKMGIEPSALKEWRKKQREKETV